MAPNVSPNSVIRFHAQGFRHAAELLFQHQQHLLPIYANSAFALELYLKSLNATETYIPFSAEGAGIPVFKAFLKVNKKGHELIVQFDDLDGAFQEGLQAAYVEKPVVVGKLGVRDALEVYDNLFVLSRYGFENDSFEEIAKIGRPVDELICLVSVIGNYVDSLPANAEGSPGGTYAVLRQTFGIGRA
jgi:hypothetical protein